MSTQLKELYHGHWKRLFSLASQNFKQIQTRRGKAKLSSLILREERDLVRLQKLKFAGLLVTVLVLPFLWFNLDWRSDAKLRVKSSRVFTFFLLASENCAPGFQVELENSRLRFSLVSKRELGYLIKRRHKPLIYSIGASLEILVGQTKPSMFFARALACFMQ